MRTHFHIHGNQCYPVCTNMAKYNHQLCASSCFSLFHTSSTLSVCYFQKEERFCVALEEAMQKKHRLQTVRQQLDLVQDKPHEAHVQIHYRHAQKLCLKLLFSQLITFPKLKTSVTLNIFLQISSPKNLQDETVTRIILISKMGLNVGNKRGAHYLMQQRCTGV